MGLEIEQEYRYEGDDWWSWSVWVEGTDEELDGVKVVEWELHPTFPNPVRSVENRASKFRLDTGGWGTFTIVARLRMENGTVSKLTHDLELLYPDDEPGPVDP